MFTSSNSHSRAVQDNWNLFKSSLLDSVSKHVLQKSIKSRCDLPWHNHEIKIVCVTENDSTTLLNKVAKVKTRQHAAQPGIQSIPK